MDDKSHELMNHANALIDWILESPDRLGVHRSATLDALRHLESEIYETSEA